MKKQLIPPTCGLLAAFCSSARAANFTWSGTAGASEAEITVAGTANLKARYGKTESLGGGTYRFKGTDICSDVLE